MGQVSSGVFLMLSKSAAGRESVITVALRQTSQATNEGAADPFPWSDVTPGVTPGEGRVTATCSFVRCHL
jgi:hypothetical protein